MKLSEEIYNIKINHIKETKPTMTNQEFKKQFEDLKVIDVNIKAMSEAVEYQAYELVTAANELNRQVIELLKEIKKYD